MNLLVSAVCVGVDALATGMAGAGMIDKDLATGLSVAATAVGAAASFGITTAVMGGVKIVGEKAVECTVKNVIKWGYEIGCRKTSSRCGVCKYAEGCDQSS